MIEPRDNGRLLEAAAMRIQEEMRHDIMPPQSPVVEVTRRNVAIDGLRHFVRRHEVARNGGQHGLGTTARVVEDRENVVGRYKMSARRADDSVRRRLRQAQAAHDILSRPIAHYFMLSTLLIIVGLSKSSG